MLCKSRLHPSLGRNWLRRYLEGPLRPQVVRSVLFWGSSRWRSRLFSSLQKHEDVYKAPKTGPC